MIDILFLVIFLEIIGIICEYNPFHNGHLYHIKKIKELYPNSLIILVLNGYFLERGEISIITKETKTSIALQYGVDIVLELPFIFGTQSADTFASISLKMLNNFHVNRIIFGSESNNINLITELAKKQLNKKYDKKVKEYLNEGINYPTALAKALNVDFDFAPNDLLAISYVKEIIKNKYPIIPESIQRTNDYHDKKSNDFIISASNIREKIKNKIPINKYLPVEAINNIVDIDSNKLWLLLKYKINTSNDLRVYLDVDEGIENRLKKKVKECNSYEEYINSIKTKRYTTNKINRMLIHIMIGLKKNDNIKNLDYIKILGMSKKGKKYLNTIKDNLVIPTIINKKSIIYKYELLASIIYDIICNTKTYNYELKNKPVIID